MATPPKREQRVVQCPKCEGELSIGARAQTVVCRHCNRTIDVQDYSVTQYIARKTFETSGDVIVEKKGTLRADVKAHHVTVRGKLFGRVLSRTGVILHAGATIEGDVETPVLRMEEGALYTGHLEIRPAVVEPAALQPGAQGA